MPRVSIGQISGQWCDVRIRVCLMKKVVTLVKTSTVLRLTAKRCEEDELEGRRNQRCPWPMADLSLQRRLEHSSTLVIPLPRTMGRFRAVHERLARPLSHPGFEGRDVTPGRVLCPSAA